MSERKFHKYKSINKEANKVYKNNILNGDVFDLLPQKHKLWFVETKGFVVNEFNEGRVRQPRQLPFSPEHHNLFVNEMREDRRYLRYNIDVLSNIIYSYWDNGNIRNVRISQFRNGSLHRFNNILCISLFERWFDISEVEEILRRYEEINPFNENNQEEELPIEQEQRF